MKKIILTSFLFLIGCTKPELQLPEPLSTNDIFSVKESSVTNGQSLHFKLPSSGVYIFKLTDSLTTQVISREKFTGQTGENVKKIYTNSLPKGYLILVLEDINKNQLGRTTIINN